MAEPRHGTRRKYNSGCRCELCKAAENQYRALLKQRRHAESAGEVVDMSEQRPESDEGSDGPVVAGVKAELAMLNSVVDRPGQAQAAIRLAKVLDNDLAIAQHSSAANRLHEILTALGKGGRNRKGNLASVRQMTTGTG